MKKYYDCSINKISNSLHNIKSLGPIENDIMSDLNKYSKDFNWQRVYDYEKADILVTNSIYPDYILEFCEKHSIPKVKRMDGIYWQNSLKYKNDINIEAASLSDHVIFISEYSEISYSKLYKNVIKERSVILNNADDNIFYPMNINNNNNFKMASSASNWCREGKRLRSIIDLSKLIDKNDIINLIGQCDFNLPKNIVKIGYLESKDIVNTIINQSDVFLALFFRDAGSKVTRQAMNCNIPTLYSSTGGLKEIVKNKGLMINDYNEIDFLDESVDININELYNKYKEIKTIYKDIKSYKVDRCSYKETLNEYFKTFNKFL